MSSTKSPLLLVGSLGEKYLSARNDSGANHSCINPEHLDGLETPAAIFAR